KSQSNAGSKLLLHRKIPLFRILLVKMRQGRRNRWRVTGDQHRAPGTGPAGVRVRGRDRRPLEEISDCARWRIGRPVVEQIHVVHKRHSDDRVVDQVRIGKWIEDLVTRAHNSTLPSAWVP